MIRRIYTWWLTRRMWMLREEINALLEIMETCHGPSAENAFQYMLELSDKWDALNLRRMQLMRRSGAWTPRVSM